MNPVFTASRENVLLGFHFKQMLCCFLNAWWWHRRVELTPGWRCCLQPGRDTTAAELFLFLLLSQEDNLISRTVCCSWRLFTSSTQFSLLLHLLHLLLLVLLLEISSKLNFTKILQPFPTSFLFFLLFFLLFFFFCQNKQGWTKKHSNFAKCKCSISQNPLGACAAQVKAGESSSPSSSPCPMSCKLFEPSGEEGKSEVVETQQEGTFALRDSRPTSVILERMATSLFRHLWCL